MTGTEAWVLYRQDGKGSSNGGAPPELRRETVELPPIGADEVLVEPIYGCWEGNMTHAVTRRPVDVCAQRDEGRVVIGNAGVVRVLATGHAVRDLREGALCMIFCNGVWDRRGYPIKIFGYDAPNTVGMLAKRTVMHRRQVIPVPEDTRFDLRQWAAFSLRYVTAWANWKAAYGCWRALAGERRPPHVWGWGGGVAFAEVTLARLCGAAGTLISSDRTRLEGIAAAGLSAVDRREFGELQFEASRYQAEAPFRERYLEAERRFLDLVSERTAGEGVSIFVDFIGAPVVRATSKALGRPGVITTAGWKQGMDVGLTRAIECMNWHLHVHTHYARYEEGLEAVEFGEAEGWMPPLEDEVHAWEDIPGLARAHARDELSTYFPIYRVNAV